MKKETKIYRILAISSIIISVIFFVLLGIFSDPDIQELSTIENVFAGLFWLFLALFFIFLVLTITSKRQSLQQNQDKDSLQIELEKYKQLLDANLITQEDFEAKKKKLLGLE